MTMHFWGFQLESLTQCKIVPCESTWHPIGISGVARAPQAPSTAGGLKGPARGPAGRSSHRNLLARGPNNLLAGGPKIVATPLIGMNK